MTPELINAISSLPVMAVLIYLLIDKNKQIDKLLDRINEMESNHIQDLIELIKFGQLKAVERGIPKTGETLL